jgi:uncharacterized protein YecE (DUF72 family)
MKRIAVGVAGWSYPDWKDTVYRLPAPAAQPSLFAEIPVAAARSSYPDDELAFLAAYLDMIEINSSFYRIPRREAVASWTARVGWKPDFFFTAKLNREFTHEFRRDRRLASEFITAFSPMQEAGLLSGLLAQFRYDVADTPEARQLLQWLHDAFSGFSNLVIEVRHRSWMSDEAVAFFRHLGVSVANLDYPTAADSFDARHVLAGNHGYFRLHGRNRKAWFARDSAAHEPYDYDYSDREIAELAAQGQLLVKEVKQLTIVANNHYRGKAVSTAARLQAALGGTPVAVPPALIKTYPHLARIAQV